MDGTVCAAHSNQLRDGKGTGIKASDAMVAAMCARCHFNLDNGMSLNKQDRRDMWDLAHRMTMQYFIEHDMLVVKT
jgi:cytochrome c553